MAIFGMANRSRRSLNDVYLAQDLERRARNLSLNGTKSQAVELYLQALDVRKKAVAGTEYDVLDKLGKTYAEMGAYQQAIDVFARAVQVLEREYYHDYPRIAPILDDWALAALKLGDLVQAEELTKRSLAIKQKSLLPQDVHTVETMRTLAEIDRRLEKYNEAEALLKQAMKVVDSATIGPVEEFLYELALVYQDQGRLDQAEQYFQQALNIFARRGGKSARYATCLKSYASLLRETDRGVVAKRKDMQAEEILAELAIEPRQRLGQNKPGMVLLDDAMYACTILH
jgi:tetratricopeptide (TPR) repeat protein